MIHPHVDLFKHEKLFDKEEENANFQLINLPKTRKILQAYSILQEITYPLLKNFQR